jgi:hypothetical protein
MKVLTIIAALTALGFATAAYADPPTVLFEAKVFTDIGNAVHVEGTLTGDGLGYKNNRTSLTCYQDTQECISVSVTAGGLRIFGEIYPIIVRITRWTPEFIEASMPTACGTSIWTINRAKKTADLIERDCHNGKVYHWTIEDPPNQ